MIIQRTPLTEAAPFDLSQLHDHARVTGINDFDAELFSLGHAAAAELEAYAGVALLDQTVTVTLDGWPRSAWLPLPVAPLLDALSVSITADGTAFEAFAVVTGLRPALRLSGAKPCGLIVIQYQAGFGADSRDIPADLTLAILDQALVGFDDKGLGDGKTNGMSPHAARIAARYRRVAL